MAGRPLGEARSLFVFGRDLRLDDHAGLAAAAAAGAVVPAIVDDPATHAALALRPRRAAFHCAAVAALAGSLEARGTALVCRRGPAAQAIGRLARETGARTVVFGSGYDAAAIARQRELQSVLEERGLRATIVHDAPAVAPEETAAARSSGGGLGYRAFPAYYAVWRQQPRVRVSSGDLRFVRDRFPSDPLPAAADFGAAAVAVPADASERGARAAFDAYLASAALVYPSARDVPGGEATSRLSAALSFGTIAARTVVAGIDDRARDPFLLAEERFALDNLRRALAFRDFFLQLAWFFEDEADRDLQVRMRAFPFARDHPALEAWRTGRTGYPFVDAGIRELRATGWMHPRARLVAASFLCFDLGVDWRIGRDVWDRELIEDEPALAAGNWQWVAGTGADLAQYPRIYNPRKQGHAFDPLGTYARRWIEELREAGDPYGVRGATPQLALPLYSGAAYPARAVDHETAARAFLRRYAAFTAPSA